MSETGQEVCGDAWGSRGITARHDDMVADGLGHGTEARPASAEAVRHYV